ncbi:MAG: helix-turn-helix transcriptional regulator [Rhodospirillales bacterium]
MIRVFHDLPQRELAARLNVVPSYLSEIEHGKKQPTLQLLESYAEEFKMPLSSIMFFSEHMSEGRSDRVRLNISNKVLALLKFIAARSGREGALGS